MNGNFRAVFEKISKLHAKNSFSLAIILGDLFADPTAASPQDEENVKALLKGEIKIPLATYFTLGKHPLPAEISDKIQKSDDDVCPNLYFLDKCCTTKTSEGIRIVNLAGTLDKAAVTTCRSLEERFLPVHSPNDARALHGSNLADILITSHWPLSIQSGSKVPIPESYPAESLAEQSVADLCTALKPRYHFSTSDQFFYEREPFSHPSDGQSEQSDRNNITRFISLAAFNNAAGAKWLYAFNLDPTAPPPPTLPPGTTLSPFSKYRKRSLDSQSESYSRFSSAHHPHQYHHHHSKRPRGPRTPAECFFCLSNPNLATHLITSIATESYLTSAKGPLSTASTFPGLGCPAHILIIPLEHSPTLGLIPDPESRKRTEKEMHRYRRALQQYVSISSSLLSSSSSSSVAAPAPAKHGPHADAQSSNNNNQEKETTKEENKKNENPQPYLGAVTWELSRTAGVHIHWQFLPIPISLITSGALQSIIKSAAAAANPHLPPFTSSSSSSSSSSSNSNDYFRIWIFNPSSSSSSSSGEERKDEEEGEGEEEEEVLTLPLPQDGLSLDAQFGRRVMANLLGLETRANWKDVVDLLPPEENIKEEERDANVFKEGFKRWDFSVEGD